MSWDVDITTNTIEEKLKNRIYERHRESHEKIYLIIH